MTTAHRATYKSAKATYNGVEQGNYSTFGTGTNAVAARDMPGQGTLKRRLDGQGTEEEINKLDLKAQLEKSEAEHRSKRAKLVAQYDDSDDDVEGQLAMLDDAGESGEDSSSSDDSSDDDDEEELMKELEKIKAERKREREAAAAAASNPIMDGGQDGGRIAQRWDDDTVFKNQARGTNLKTKARFINDTVRNDFHRRFMNKYIK
jgi:protein CWC15